jgi:hypothetical protein
VLSSKHGTLALYECGSCPGGNHCNNNLFNPRKEGSKMNKLALTLAAACALALSSSAIAEQGSGRQGPGMGGPGGGQGQGGQSQGGQSQGGPGGQQGPTPEQFKTMKSKMLEHHQKRAAIIQQGQSCIQSATTAEQLKGCIQQERQSEQQLREQIRADMPRRQGGSGPGMDGGMGGRGPGGMGGGRGPGGPGGGDGDYED